MTRVNYFDQIKYSSLYKGFIVECSLLGVEASVPILIAVSGGVDSMVMANLFLSAGYNFSVAHVNFNLRASQSVEDMEFVRKWCSDNGVHLFVKEVDTLKYSEENKLSIEMAAREIRYDFFKEISAEKGFDYVAVAHNANDNVETLFLNLLRGTGLKGICGIQKKNGKVIRPLMFAKRSQIEDFAKTFGIEYREDKTNSENIFRRNKIRNQILPLFEQITPSAIENFTNSIYNFREARDFHLNIVEREMLGMISVISNSKSLNFLYDNYLKEVISLGEVVKSISSTNQDLNSQIKMEAIKFHLNELGFSFSVTNSILNSVRSKISGSSKGDFTSKIFHSNCGLVALLDRDSIKIYSKDILLDAEQLSKKELIISQLEECNRKGSDCEVEGQDYKVELSNKLLCTISLQVIDAQNFDISRLKEKNEGEEKTLYLDFSKINFPLKIRWLRSGDTFSPIGLKGRKSVADFLNDKNIDSLIKPLVPLLISSESIIAIPDIEIAEDVKVTSATSKILVIKIL